MQHMNASEKRNCRFYEQRITAEEGAARIAITREARERHESLARHYRKKLAEFRAGERQAL